MLVSGVPGAAMTARHSPRQPRGCGRAEPRPEPGHHARPPRSSPGTCAFTRVHNCAPGRRLLRLPCVHGSDITIRVPRCRKMFATAQKTTELWMWKMEYLHHEQRPLYFGEWF